MRRSPRRRARRDPRALIARAKALALLLFLGPVLIGARAFAISLLTLFLSELELLALTLGLWARAFALAIRALGSLLALLLGLLLIGARAFAISLLTLFLG